MIRTVICDDEAESRACLAALIRAQPWPCEVVEYASAGECLAGGPEADLLFLDIALEPSGGAAGGMELARQLRARAQERQPVIIFVTGYDQYVFDAFDVGAFHYLLKPVDEVRFAQVFARAVEQLRTAPAPALTVHSASASRVIPLDSIYYIESSDHKVVLHWKGGALAYYAKIRDLELELRGRFFRTHKGYLVNLAYVSGYSKAEVTLTNGETLLLSKYKYQDFVRAYLHFLRQGGGR